MNINIKFKKLSPDAITPRSNAGDVGFDVASVESLTIPARGCRKIKTGIALADYTEQLVATQAVNTPYEFSQNVHTTSFLKVESRSGLASKGVFTNGGIIDPQYRGEIHVILFNFTDSDFVVEKGMRIAQLIYYVTISNNDKTTVNFVEVDEIGETSRGAKGFGSSGLK